MKYTANKFYRKMYKKLLHLTNSFFGKNVIDSLVLYNSLKQEIESKVGKNISEITNNELLENSLVKEYSEYITLFQIFNIWDKVCIFNLNEGA